MLIMHRPQPNGAPGFAFFRVPKSGSTTMEFMLRMTDLFFGEDVCTAMQMGGFGVLNTPDFAEMQKKGDTQKMGGVNHMHYTPEQAIADGYITQQQLEDYNVFVTVREPLSRFFSMFKHQYRRIPDPAMFKKCVLEGGGLMPLLEVPTVDYVYSNGVRVSELLDFDDYIPELRRMLASVGADTFPVIPRLNVDRSMFLNDFPTGEEYWNQDDKLKGLVRERFAADVALYDSWRAGTLQ